jgi:RimJ/RimL family protein N-acetyltransferase
MELIAVAHPDFREELIKKAREKNIIYADQAFVPGLEGQYPEHLEQLRITKTGRELLFRPVKITDEPLLKEFFYSLSDTTIYKRFFAKRKDMPHEVLQKYSVIDYTEEMVVVAVLADGTRETAVAMGQYKITEETHTADAAIVVRDDYQGMGIGTELSKYLVYLARRSGLVAFTADVLHENEAMLHIFEKSGFGIERTSESGVFRVRLNFKKESK